MRGQRVRIAGLCVVLAACAPSSPATPHERLATASLEPIEIAAERGVTFRGRVPTTGAGLEERARTFLDRHGDALGTGDRLGTLELLEARVESGEQGAALFGYAIDGVPVLDARVSVHTSRAGEIVFATVDLPATDTIAGTVPAIERAEAEALAIAGTAARVVDAELGIHAADLWDPEASGSSLAWRVRLAGANGDSPTVVLDATTGAIIERGDETRRALARTIHSARYGRDLGAASDLLATEAMPDTPDPQARETFANLGLANEFFDYHFDWESRDGGGAFPIVAYVHYGGEPSPGDPDPDVAAPEGSRTGGWVPSHEVFIFGDLATTPSITVHEYTHMLIDQLADLRHMGEPGSVDESLADAFAALATGVWALRCSDGELIRDMAAPSSVSTDLDPTSAAGSRLARPNHLSSGAGWVEQVGNTFDEAHQDGWRHHNSSIPTYAIYLAVNGGVHPVTDADVAGMGSTRMRHVLWRIVRWGRIGGLTTFLDLRQAMVAACVDYVRGDVSAPDGTPFDITHCGAISHAFGAAGVGELDRDQDTWGDSMDRCPDVVDFDQRDSDGDRRGDACDPPDGAPPITICHWNDTAGAYGEGPGGDIQVMGDPFHPTFVIGGPFADRASTYGVAGESPGMFWQGLWGRASCTNTTCWHVGTESCDLGPPLPATVRYGDADRGIPICSGRAGVLPTTAPPLRAGGTYIFSTNVEGDASGVGTRSLQVAFTLGADTSACP